MKTTPQMEALAALALDHELLSPRHAVRIIHEVRTEGRDLPTLLLAVLERDLLTQVVDAELRGAPPRSGYFPPGGRGVVQDPAEEFLAHLIPPTPARRRAAFRSLERALTSAARAETSQLTPVHAALAHLVVERRVMPAHQALELIHHAGADPRELATLLLDRLGELPLLRLLAAELAELSPAPQPSQSAADEILALAAPATPKLRREALQALLALVLSTTPES